MTALKCSAAALALFLASSMAYAEDATGTSTSGTTGTTTSQSGTATTDSSSTATGADSSTTQSGTASNAADCPAAGTVAEADLSAECKTQADMSTSTDSGASTAGTTTTTTTTEIPKTGADTSASGSASTTGDAATTTAMTPSAGTMSNAILASQFIGQTVYSTANESVGEINDLVLNRELDTINAIIGVGGFLGIGEKDVAIPVNQLTATKDENDSIRLTIGATKEQLEAAPAFDRTALN